MGDLLVYQRVGFQFFPTSVFPMLFWADVFHTCCYESRTQEMEKKQVFTGSVSGFLFFRCLLLSKGSIFGFHLFLMGAIVCLGFRLVARVLFRFLMFWVSTLDLIFAHVILGNLIDTATLLLGRHHQQKSQCC